MIDWRAILKTCDYCLEDIPVGDEKYSDGFVFCTDCYYEHIKEFEEELYDMLSAD